MSKPQKRVTARTMIVTGASSGIGRALALGACGAGYDVVAVGRRAAELSAVAHSVARSPGTIETLPVDLLEAGAPAQVVAVALRRYGRIDVIVNAAGVVARGAITDQSDAALREQFLLHAIVPLAIVREALPALRATRGHIFFVGSGVARVPVGGLGAYPPAKAAVRSAARIARNEVRRDGIRVTYVDPGAVDTAFMRRAGLRGATGPLLRSPDAVAAKMLRAVGSSRTAVNAAPWQTAFVRVAELAPAVTDAVLARFPQIVGAQPLRRVTERSTSSTDAAAAAPPSTTPDAEQQTAAMQAPSDLDVALEPLARRMERLRLPRSAVESWLQPGATLSTGDVALRWAGMPNKNERALVYEVLSVLADHGFLERQGDERYAVTSKPRCPPSCP